MKTIYKYQLPVAAKCTLHMPKGARLLCVAEQNDAYFGSTWISFQRWRVNYG